MSTPPVQPPQQVALCITCLGDQIMPQVGVAAVRLLKRAGYTPANQAHADTQVDAPRLEFPPGQTCCGQPFFNSGFQPEAVRLAKHTIETFEDYQAVVVPSGSCTAMIRVEYPHLLAEDPHWSERARALAAKTFELSEFLLKICAWKPQPNQQAPRVTYHDSCHMKRLLGLGREARELLEMAGCEVQEMPEGERCCGFGGLFSFRMPELANAMTARKLENGAQTGAAVLVSADPGCLMQMRSHPDSQADNAIRLEHVAEILEELTA